MSKTPVTCNIGNAPPVTSQSPDAALRAAEASDHGSLGMLHDMSCFLRAALQGRQPWVARVLLDALDGQYGATVAQSMAMALEDGIYDAGVQKPVSFLSHCADNDTMPLFAAIVEQGAPATFEPLREWSHRHATTPNGVWLDVLCNVTGNDDVSVTPSSAPQQINALAATPHGVALADLLVRHDSHHRAIASLQGTAGHAVIMESMMRARINTLSGERVAVNDSAEAPAARRRTRHV